MILIANGKLGVKDGKMELKNCSEKNDDLRTIECLRGRLLAERQASKVANEDAETMSNKLIELESQLKEETKLWNKAEKKLRFLKKKIESLNLSLPLDESEESSSSDIHAHSCRSSTTTSTSGLKVTEESDQFKPQIRAPKTSDINDLDNNFSDQSHESFATPENSSSSATPNSNIKDPPHEASSPDSDGDSKTDNHFQSYTSKKTAMGADSERDDEDNSLALVAVKCQTNQVKTSSRSVSVREALDALRLARERIQSSMARRHMIRVGHS